MTERLRNKCDLFLRNRNAVSKKFMFEKDMMSIAAGLIFTGADKEVDIEKLNECRKILAKHTGFFSEYRDAVKLALISEMVLSENPEQYIEDVKSVYRKLHKGRFKDNSYMVLAAMLTCDLGKQESADVIVEKHNEIMKQMKKQHPILTDSEDISYVILLALSDRPIDYIISDMNECFDYLRKTRKIKAGSDSVQGLSEILALTDGNMREKCDKVISFYDILKDKKVDINGGYSFSALGALIGIDETPEVIANDIIEADVFLDGCKGFDEKSVNKNKILMFALMLVAESYGSSTSVISNTFINNALGIIKAKQIATMITIISNVLPTVLGAVLDNVSDKNDNGETEEANQESDKT